MNGRIRLHQEIKTLLEYAPKVDRLLDVGFGDGDLSIYFRKKGTNVVATGINIDHYKTRYATDFERLRNYNIDIVESNVENMPFDDACFDGVLASHVLEHTANMGIALQEIRRILRGGGICFALFQDLVSLL